MAGWVGIFHHVDHSLLHGHIDLHGDGVVETHSLADLFDKGIQSRHFLHVVGKHDAFLHFDVTLLFDILYGHHRQVVTLFGIAHKLVDGISHCFYQVVWSFGRLVVWGSNICS